MPDFFEPAAWQPTKITFEESRTLLAEKPYLRIIDQYLKNLEELFLLRHPQYRFDTNYQAPFEAFVRQQGDDLQTAGSWFLYPWSNQTTHFLPDEMHQELRTGRNRNLITAAEQNTYYNSKISILGMSVGSHVAATVAMTGGSKNLRLADPDVYSGDNLNRVRTGFQDVGMSKAVVMARKLFEVDPYASHVIYPEGLQESNVQTILDTSDIIIEEMDNLYWKLKIRELARSRRIPVVMGTDNGDGMIVDVERFDLDSSYPILHGSIGELTAEMCQKVDPHELPRVYAKVAGAELAVPRMLASVAEVGKTLYSWPQLGTAANLCGTVVSYLARRIILKDAVIKSGRYEVNLDSIFDHTYNDPEVAKQREEQRGIFLKNIGVF